ncbi:hypothetical protein [Mesobacillus sp. S13]|uniref:hypothetical protein n=1 Tax=Mesobacillus sp. S13 TaxID=2880221 RepID=UPI001CF5C0DB|nr:hypothetical protein [Mesobacillus sp. S13]
MNILTEGSVVQSEKFVNGILENGQLYVGDYEENSIFDFSKGTRANDFSRGDKKYVVIGCWEMEAAGIIMYQNRFLAKELNEDGTYNAKGEEINFSTAGVYRGSIRESDISIIKVMKKVFI